MKSNSSLVIYAVIESDRRNMTETGIYWIISQVMVKVLGVFILVWLADRLSSWDTDIVILLSLCLHQINLASGQKTGIAAAERERELC